MKTRFILPSLCFILISLIPSFGINPSQIKAWKAQSNRVNIIRDEYGVPHIYGKSDADAVFGLLYAQCEDDFMRVEMNYIEKLGRKAEVFGPSELANDLYIRLIISQEEAKQEYKTSPLWLKKLLDAYANAINYFLYKHPEVKPALITHFEPWYPLLWTDGSIGAISTGSINQADVAKFYGLSGNKLSYLKKNPLDPEADLTGSNGFAVGPAKSKSGNSLFYINPHVTFYFRPEVHVNSEEGLNVYGAVTWGQIFVYQGFNQYGGWMHTSSQVDVADNYAENIRDGLKGKEYLLDGKWLPMQEQNLTLKVKGQTPQIIHLYSNHRGPIMAERNGKWISVKSYNRSIKSLIQSWARTKTKSFEEFQSVMNMRANTSNNTVYAGKNGRIAYWHGNFVPKRQPEIDWSLIQDGTKSSLDWQGLHPLKDIVQSIDPASAWIQNCNSTPFTVSGESSPKKSQFPVYMAPDAENFRDKNAFRLFSTSDKLDLDDLIRLGYDRKLTAFEILIPALVKAGEKRNLGPNSTFGMAIDTLKKWDFQARLNSVAQTLAIQWGQKMLLKIPKKQMFGGEIDLIQSMEAYITTGKGEEMCQVLDIVLQDLTKNWGTWQVAWGDINRLQRITNQVDFSFDDTQASYPVPFASSTWGMLPSYNSKPFSNTKKWYGVNGNSFICAVEFGPKIKAKSLLAGGQSGDIRSAHFFDQAQNYAEGKFKEVHFYREDVLKHQKSAYHP
ncbi:penicillin acylase family protein [Aquirufa aurantiipilula]|uniref:penicillin acylase family protein n=1 Tax=Aquirufa aurantiipilula TaxID=2696561 RepID=UPI001CAA6792|nr:penicillin acylase family protein [Aquirufa aurantiipilula]MBZ1327047.1 acylase [Aquirufa aurantiipilula]